MAARYRIGIDLGGTKIEAAAVDRLAAVRVRRRIATPTENYCATIAAITALVGLIELLIGETAPVGVGMPGTISPITGLAPGSERESPLEDGSFSGPTRLPESGATTRWDRDAHGKLLRDDSSDHRSRRVDRTADW